jgi:multiple antibiotic resistance protein
MLEYTDYIKIFIALLAVVDPIGCVPIFVALIARSSSPELRSIEKTVVITVSLILLMALFFGEGLLVFFGISIHSFEVSGGILLMLMAIDMLKAKISATIQTKAEAQEGEAKPSIAVVPLSIPLLAGPGAISTVVLYANQGNHINHYLMMSVDIMTVVMILWAVLRCAPWLTRQLSQTSINVFTRLMGLILSALAVEFIASGLKGLFPGLAG